jgi:DNA-binding transcriptional ArsR family regulator
VRDELTATGPADVRSGTAGSRLLSDPTRIKILWALLQGESSVACLAELVGAAPTAVSQHLAKLRLSGLVRGRREGTFVYYYSAADVHVRRLLEEALYPADRDLRQDSA